MTHSGGSLPKNVSDWFALTTRPQHERVVADSLAAHSIEAYVPYYRSKRRWSDRTKVIELPLFSRYVFSRYGLEKKHIVITIPGVVSVVTFGKKPARIKQEEIELLKRLASHEHVMPWPYVRLGERVRVSGGPLCGVEGTLVREKASFRVVVNIDILQRAVAVELERDLIEPVSEGLHPVNLTYEREAGASSAG